MTTCETAEQPVTLEESDLWLRRGSMDEADLKQLLVEICATIDPLHERGQVHGRIAPASICIDSGGSVCVEPIDIGGDEPLQAARRPAGQKPLFGILPDGYAAFEQYMDEAAWPVGPWTDVHALSALAHALIAGNAPQDAVTRMASQRDIVFDYAARQRYSARMLAAVRRGLAIDTGIRQQSLNEFLLSMGVMPYAPEAANTTRPSAVTPPTTSPATVPLASYKPSGQGKPLGRALPLVVLVLLGTGVAIWWSQKPETVNSVQATPPQQQAGLPAAAPDAPVLTLAKVDPVLETATPSLAQADPVSEAQMAPLGQVDPVSDAQVAHPAQADSVPEAPHQAQVLPSSDHITTNSEDTHERGQGDALAAQAGAAGEPDAQEPVATEVGSTAAMKKEPEQVAVEVHVNVRPWGEVFIDGTSRGVSPPLKALSLPPGEYQVSIRNGDLPPAQSTLAVKAGRRAAISHEF